MNAQVQPNLTLVDRHYLTPDADRIHALSTQWNPSSAAPIHRGLMPFV